MHTAYAVCGVRWTARLRGKWARSVGVRRTFVGCPEGPTDAWRTSASHLATKFRRTSNGLPTDLSDVRKVRWGSDWAGGLISLFVGLLAVRRTSAADLKGPPADFEGPTDFRRVRRTSCGSERTSRVRHRTSVGRPFDVRRTSPSESPSEVRRKSVGSLSDLPPSEVRRKSERF